TANAAGRPPGAFSNASIKRKKRKHARARTVSLVNLGPDGELVTRHIAEMKPLATWKFMSFRHNAACSDHRFFCRAQIVSIKNDSRRPLDRRLAAADAAVDPRSLKADVIGTPILKCPAERRAVKLLERRKIRCGEFDIVDRIVFLAHLRGSFGVAAGAGGDRGDCERGEFLFHAASLTRARRKKKGGRCGRPQSDIPSKQRRRFEMP